jgi:glucose/arabinose dehydrogenase
MTPGLRVRGPLVALSAALVACAALAIPSSALAQSLRTVRIASGLTRPLFVTHAPGDTSRIFIVEQGSGGVARIKIYKPATGMVNATPFLTLNNVATGGDEQGLLGLAFHPLYPDTPYFFINFTRSADGATVVRRYNVSTTNPDSADGSTGLQVMLQSQPQANHNGGWIAFGPDDGYLYIGLGDGGGAGDSGTGHDPLVGNGQSDATRLGKILRINVNTVPYSIPPDNPFVGQGSPKEEFWAKGVRNPWRNSFDRVTGDFFIADVGQNQWEEINFEPASDPGGRNYGWRKFEGYAIFNCPIPCDSSGLTRPIHVYNHVGHCSVTGGYVYRGSAIPDMYGKYFFADYCSDQIWTLCVVNNASTEVTNRTADLAPGGGLILDDITSFGEDAFGELYITDRDGEIYSILPDLPGGADITPPSASVQVPNGGQVYIIGTIVPIQWDASDNFGVVGVDILFSSDGGATYPQTLATDLPNGCVYYWDTTGFSSTTMARIKVVARDAAGNSIEDASNANFTLISAAPQVVLIDPNGGESIPEGTVFTIQWSASDDIGVTGVDLELSLDGGATFPIALASGIANTGEYDWTVADTPTANARVRARVSDADLQTAQDASDADFAITNADTHVPGSGVPETVFLSANAPEPFSELTRVTYGVPRATNATLQVYSTEGRAIRTLVSERVEAGRFEETWDGRDAAGTRVAAGLYFLKLSTPEGDVTRRITLVK